MEGGEERGRGGRAAETGESTSCFCFDCSDIVFVLGVTFSFPVRPPAAAGGAEKTGAPAWRSSTRAPSPH